MVPKSRMELREVHVLSRRAFASAVLGTAFITTRSAFADTYPSRAIRVVSPFPAGSASDTTARVVLDQLSQFLGQAMVVENKAGAGGVVGFADVAKADPDGYTLVTSSSSMANGLVLHQHLPYDPLRDFVPVAIFGVQPNVLVASKQSGFKTVADLVAAAKAKPGTLTFASAGVGSIVAYGRREVPPRRQDRRSPYPVPRGRAHRSDGGTDRLLFHSAGGGRLCTGSGKLSVLAVSTPKRSALLPDAPTVAEAGYPDAEFNFWVGLSAPAKTPSAIVDKIHDATEKALQVEAVKDKLAKLGVVPELMSVAQFDKFFKDDLDATVKLAKDADIQAVD